MMYELVFLLITKSAFDQSTDETFQYWIVAFIPRSSNACISTVFSTSSPISASSVLETRNTCFINISRFSYGKVLIKYWVSLSSSSAGTTFLMTSSMIEARMVS